MVFLVGEWRWCVRKLRWNSGLNRNGKRRKASFDVRCAEQVMIQTNLCSVYNSHARKRHEKERARVVNDFRSTLLSQTCLDSVTKFLTLPRIMKWDNTIPNRSVEAHRTHLSHAPLGMKRKSVINLALTSWIRRALLSPPWLCIGIHWTWGRAQRLSFGVVR